MIQFFFGVLVGFTLMGIATFTVPLLLSGVQQELVSQGHGFYNPLTRNFILKECK